LHPYVVAFGITEMIKHTIYDVGESYARGFALLGCYAAAGLLLSLVGKQLRQRWEVRRILAGRTTMFMDAQTASREHAVAEREKILAHYCRDPQQAHELAVAAVDDGRSREDALAANSRPIDGIEDRE
jgi:hypothetical protein